MNKKAIYGVSILGIILLIVVGFLVFHFVSREKGPDPIQWVLVLKARHAEIDKNPQGELVLNLDDSKIEKVTAIYDKSAEKTKSLSPTQYIGLWEGRKHTFAKGPLNAIVVGEKDKLSLKLISAQVHGYNTAFVIKDDKKIRAKALGANVELTLKYNYSPHADENLSDF